MKEVDVGTSGKCLIIRHEDGDVTALGHKCTHYGAPLVRGTMNGRTIRCPWHGACFDGKTGDIEDYPGLDSLQKYKVSIDKKNGDVKVRASLKNLREVKRNACVENESAVDAYGEKENVVIIGGGPASLVCAETLRKEGFTGDVKIICEERHPPYDRAKLSKAPDASPQDIYLRGNLEYYAKIKVELNLNTKAISINTEEKKITIKIQNEDQNRCLNYDHLFIATGGKPRTLHPLPGSECKNILVLRTLDDANKIAPQCRDKKVVLVGSSFIAMEIAAFLSKQKESSSLTVICGRRSKVPFESSLGSDIGGLVMKMHQEKGIKFHTSTTITELMYNDENCVTHVKLSDGTLLAAEVIILGIGVTPSTDFLSSSKIDVDEKGFIAVDCGMRTNVANVYAGGDIVTFPLGMKGGERSNVQHWQMAHKHGKIAGNSIINSYIKQDLRHNESTHVQSIPFFWTVQFGISMRYAGHGGGFDKVVIKGVQKDGNIIEAAEALSAKKFIGFYVKQDNVVAVATMMADPIAARYAEHIKSMGYLKASQIDDFLKDEIKNKDKCEIS